MKTEVLAKSKVAFLVKVELPPDIVSHKLEEVYRKTIQDMEMPGFRRGKIPRRLLEAKFGQDFFYEDSRNELIQEYLPKALEELNLRPVSTPQTKVIEFADGKPFVFEADLEVLPEVEVREYKGIEIEEPPKKKVTKKEVKAAQERLQLEHGLVVPKEGECVEEGDIAVIKLDNEKEEHEVRLEELVGHKINEEVRLLLGGEEHRVRIIGLRKIELPLMEDLAKELGHESLEELEAATREDLKTQLAKEHAQAIRLAILDKIVAQTNIEVPPRMRDELVAQELELLRKSGYSLPKEEEQKKLKELMERRIRRDLVLEAIKKQENIKISDEELEKLLKEEAERQGMNLLKFKALLESEGRLEAFRKEKEHERVLQFLYENAIIKTGPGKKPKSEEEEGG